MGLTLGRPASSSSSEEAGVKKRIKLKIFGDIGKDIEGMLNYLLALLLF